MEKQPSIFQPDIGVLHLVDPPPQERELLLELFAPDGKEAYYVQLGDVALQDVKENNSTCRKHGVEQRRRFWNGVRKSKGLRPLCYEHHITMEPSHFPLSAGKPTQIHSYACPKRGCSVGYNSQRGYSMTTQGREYTKGNMTPRVSCPADGRLMYLAQVKPEMTSFRLWRCPQCTTSVTNASLDWPGRSLQSTRGAPKRKRSRWYRV
jgi:hypothetical protein